LKQPKLEAAVMALRESTQARTDMDDELSIVVSNEIEVIIENLSK
jgi:hypothetical protein